MPPLTPRVFVENPDWRACQNVYSKTNISEPSVSPAACYLQPATCQNVYSKTNISEPSVSA
ncbi:MAG: hypothetical protein PHC50_05005 [Candidatus Cloacimonetes bacterium]|nr:hypothetical protein [Candidatus Cloacimonadota bacterium]